MAQKYFAYLTTRGEAKLAQATALGIQLKLTQMGVGDGGGTLPMPTPSQTKLINEKRRAGLNSLTVDPQNPGQLIAEQIIPENEGGWWIREIGLYDDTDELIAIANCAETYKPLLAEGSGRTQAIRMVLIVSSTDAVTLKIDPSVILATRKYVDDTAIVVKAYADDVMKSHVSDPHPHKQYLRATMHFRELAELGSDAVRSARENIELDRVVQDTNETRIWSPDKQSYMFIQNGVFGAYSIKTPAGGLSLGVGFGGTGAKDAAGARSNLGLGDSSTRDVGTAANTVAAGNDSRITGAMQKSQNGADIPDKSKFRESINLGRVEQDAAETRIWSPDGKSYILIQNGTWGAYSTNASAGGLSLGLGFGGTGAKDAAGARSNLGLGNSATRDVGTSANTVAAGNDSRITGAMQKSQNGSDIPDANAFRSNIGLGSSAIRAVGNGVNQIPDMNYFSAALSINGWAKLPNGLIIQQGTSTAATPSQPDVLVNFPIPFPTGVLHIGEHDSNGGLSMTLWQLNNITRTAFYAAAIGGITRGNTNIQAMATSTACNWFVIGY